MNITLPKELSALLETETIELIDVRNKSEYDEVHIPLAKLIPLHLLPLKWKEIDTKKSIICICRSGGRSGQACTFLSTVGITASNFV